MAATHSGFLVQSTFGTVGNFEVVAPRFGGGLDHFWRDNDAANTPWIGPKICFGSTDDPNDGSLIQSNYSGGNLEAIFIDRGRLFHYYRGGAMPQHWLGESELPGIYTAVGRPALIQSTFGTVGNFEVVAPLSGGGMAHWWRDNDQTAMPWTLMATFGTGTVDAVALLQSNYGSIGKNLEVVALIGGQLEHYWRADTTPFAWTHQATIASNVTGSPGFIQSSYGTVGNFEVVAPVAGGGMAHWWRDNDDPNQPWYGPTFFGSGTIDSVSLIQSNYFGGNFEVIARSGTTLEHYYRDFTTLTWNKTQTLPQVTCDPLTAGQCTIPWRSRTVGIHNAMCHTDEVVLFGFQFVNSNTGESSTLNPFTGLTTLSSNIDNHFCSGHSFLPDGRLMVAGGHAGHEDALTIYNPVTRTWLPHIHMNDKRWYPTCTTLDTGDIFIISGSTPGGPIGPNTSGGVFVNNTWEIWNGNPALVASGTNPSAPWSVHFPTNVIPNWGTTGKLDTIDLYPFVYVIPTGNGILSGQLFIHSRNTTRFFDYRTNVWDPRQLRTISPDSRTYGGEGTSVLLPLRPEGAPTNPVYPAKVLVAGGSGLDTFPSPGLGQNTPATNTAEIIDLSGPTPTWRNTNQPTMNYPRVMLDAVLLPDGKVLIVGGSSAGKSDIGIDPVLPIEIFDPGPETFTTLCTMNVPRLYHATAVLLPDATVLIAGKDGNFNDVPYKYPEYRAEIFSPPYLFQGPRPTIVGAGAIMQYNVDFHIQTPDASEVHDVVLIRQSSVTHSFNMDQRMIYLHVDSVTNIPPGLNVLTPLDRTVAPPGFYMLFLVSAMGVPSVAVWVQLV